MDPPPHSLPVDDGPSCFNPNYVLENYYIKELLYIYCGTRFSVLDIVQSCMPDKNTEPHRNLYQCPSQQNLMCNLGLMRYLGLTILCFQTYR